VKEKHCHWNVEVVVITMGMMKDAMMMGSNAPHQFLARQQIWYE